MNGIDVFVKLMDFIETAPELFPRSTKKSWTPTLTAFFYYLGTSEGYEVRCGDYFAYLANIRVARGLASLPRDFDQLCRPWVKDSVRAHGLLAIDACWVPKGFSIPRKFGSVPRPDSAHIILAYEHEDEGTLYTDKRGTNIHVVLDEIRKIGNVKSDMKIISYITSREEIDDQTCIEKIQDEIKLVPMCENLTKEWFIIQIAKYERKSSRKKKIIKDGRRVLDCRGIALNSAGDVDGEATERAVMYPT